MLALPLLEVSKPIKTASDRIVINVGGRRLKTTAAFRSYWFVAAERQAMLFRRLRGDAILTHDPILRAHRFTNAYRAADRVTQFFISHVAPKCDPDPKDIFFRTLIFKTFNRIETWNSLEAELGEPIRWNSFDFKRYNAILTGIQARGSTVYSNAYMMPNPAFGHVLKHSNHLDLISKQVRDGLPERIASATSLERVYELLKSVPSFGPFLAFQYAIDLNYTEMLDFAESDFVVAGPGALDGIAKCFTDTGGLSAADVIKVMADITPQEMARAGLNFNTLWGRPLQLIDCQNLFCEVDKYSRVKHPELTGESGRSRIKQRYNFSKGPLPTYTFPRKWKIDGSRPFGDVELLNY